MPIHGLTDRGTALPEIGQIRKGGPKTDPRRPGPDLDYFRVTFDERETQREQAFRAIYGDKPREINVLLPFDEIPQVWDAWFESYLAGRMVARSDGERMIYQSDPATGEVLVMGGEPYKPHPADGVVGAYHTQDGRVEQVKLKPVGRLKVVVPELQSLACLVVLTTSIHDIANISKQLEGIKTLNGGRIAGVPLVLRRRPKKISAPKADGTRVRTVKWLLSIEADPAWVRAKLSEMQRLALPGDGVALLPEEIAESLPDDLAENDTDDFDEGVFEPEAEPEIEPDEMTIEAAEYELSVTTGELYGSIPTEALAHRLNAMLKVKNPTAEQRRKIQAARMILQARADGRPVLIPD